MSTERRGTGLPWSRPRVAAGAVVVAAGLAIAVWWMSAGPSDGVQADRVTAVDAALDAIARAAPRSDADAPGGEPATVDAHRARARSLLQRASRLPASSWSSVIPPEAARSPIPLNFTEKGELVMDERVKDTFAYYLSTIAATVGEVEAAARLLAELQAMPEPARSRMHQMLEGYLAAESALEAHARAVKSSSSGQESSRALARLQAAAQTGDVQARRLALHEVQLAAQSFQAERERIIAAQGGEEVVDLYASMNQRARRELAVDLALSNPAGDVRTRLADALKALGLKARQAIDEPTGAVRAAYERLDARAISTDPAIPPDEKQRLRLEFFGDAYVADVSPPGAGR